MQTLIFCDNINPHLNPLCENSPVPTLRILDKTLLELYVENLSEQGLSNFTVVAPKRVGELLTITQKLKKHFDVTLLSADLTELRVTRHAWLGDDVLVVHCDRNTPPDVKKLAKIHTDLNSPLTFYAETNAQKPFSDLQTTSTNFSPVGVYILSKELVATVPLETKMQDIFELALSTADAVACPLDDKSFQINTPSDFTLANKLALENSDKSPLKNFLSSDGFVNMSGKNLHGVTVIPPVFVGENVTVGSGTVLDSGTIIGKNSTVENGVYVKNSIVGEGCFLGEKSSLTDTVLERAVTLQKGVCCEKMTIIGSNTFVGEDTLVKKNTKISSGKKISPCQTITQNVELNNDGEIHFDDLGIISDFNAKITPELSARLGCAVASSVEIDQSVVVGYHGKNNAKIIAKTIAMGLNFCGVDAWILPNSTFGEIAYAMNKTSSPLAIEVSSDFKMSVHVFSKGGLKLSPYLESQIETNLNLGIFRFNPQNTGETSDGQAFQKMYLDFLQKSLPTQFSKLNVKIKTSDNALAVACDKIFPCRNDINGETITFHLNPQGEGISAYSEKTGYVFRDKLTLAVVKSHLASDYTVPLPETFPKIAETLTQNTHGEILRYPLDTDSKTTAKILSRAENLCLIDPLALCVKIVSILQTEKITLKKLVDSLPKFYSAKRFVCVDCKKIEGFPHQITSPDNKSHATLVRGKNNKSVTVFVDSEKMEIATSFCDEIENFLKTTTTNNE